MTLIAFSHGEWRKTVFVVQILIIMVQMSSVFRGGSEDLKLNSGQCKRRARLQTGAASAISITPVTQEATTWISLVQLDPTKMWADDQIMETKKYLVIYTLCLSSHLHFMLPDWTSAVAGCTLVYPQPECKILKIWNDRRSVCFIYLFLFQGGSWRVGTLQQIRRPPVLYCCCPCLVFKVHVLCMSCLSVVRVTALWMVQVQLRPYVWQILMQTLRFHFGCKVAHMPKEQDPVCSSEACSFAL